MTEARQPAQVPEGYVHCPECAGSKYLMRITRPGDGWLPTVSEMVPCERCGFTGVVPEGD